MIVFGLAGALVASGVMTATASVRLVRVGSVPVLPSATRVEGPVASTRTLSLTVALQPGDAAGLQAFATAVATPGSPDYRHYLTVDQFAQRFGAPASHIAAVQSALRAQGLTVGAPTANDLQLPVSGTVAQIDTTFSVSESQVKLASGRVTYANDQAPVLPSSVAGDIQSVMGLDDVTVPQPQDVSPRLRRSSATRAGSARRALTDVKAHSTPHAIGSGPAPCPEATTDAQGTNPESQTGYTADEIAGAYGLSSYYPGNEGQGATVGLLEEVPYQASDVAAYQSCYGTSASVSNVNVGQGIPAYTSGDNDGEPALDIEQVIGLAPKANIIVYQEQGSATSAADILNAMVSANQAKVLSSSYGACEKLTDQSVITSENTTLQEAAVQGQSFFISSGDSGSTHCYQATRTTKTPDYSLSVLDPAGQPFATGVGGTSMGAVVNNGTQWSLPTNGSYPGEYVWNDGTPSGVPNPSAATGGGVSDQWAMPSYQSSAAGSLNVISSNSSRTCGGNFCREVPDVAADGDYFNSGYAFYYNGGSSGGGWNINAGTSAAAPLWAAFTALADASAACRGIPLGFMNPVLYQVAGGSYLSNFHDVTQNSPFGGYYGNGTDSGNDAFGGQNPDNPSQLFPVASGYDMTTGLGTPIANVLGNSLCGVVAPAYTVTVTPVGAVTTKVGQSVSLQIHGSDSGGAPLTFTSAGLPTGLGMSGAGLITGTPTTPQTATVTVTATDTVHNAGSTQFTWTIAKPVGKPTASGVSLGGLASHKPTLKFTLAAGPNAPALKSVSVTLPGGLSFAKKAKSLSKGISVKNGGKFKLAVKGGALTITLKGSARKLTVKIGKPAISVSGSLASKVKHHKVKKLTVKLKATDTSKKSTTYSSKLKVK